jgi:preprotein translocase subunit SecA
MVDENTGEQFYDHAQLFEDANELFPLVDHCTVGELEKYQPGPELLDFITSVAMNAYQEKTERLGDAMAELERFAMLKAVNDRWQDHLQTIEYIREGIGLRGYGQVDPLVAYKRETYDLFQQTEKTIRTDAVKLLFRLNVQMEQPAGMPMAPMDLPEPSPALEGGGTAVAVQPKAEPGALPFPGNVDAKRVGRNDPCPCGSGLKFKECHYKVLRASGII